MKIIHRYVIRELIGPFIFGVTTATSIMMLSRVFKMVEMIISKGIDVLTVLELFAYFLPAILALTIPMAMLIGTLMAFGRLSSDNEITALKASGVSIISTILPVFLVGIMMSIGLYFFLDRVVPESNLRFKNLLLDIGMKRPDMNLKERIFIRDFPGYEMYIGDINESTGEMTDITIFNIQGGLLKSTIVAKKGKILPEYRDGYLTFELYDGELHEAMDNAPKTYRRMHFDSQLFNLEYNSELIRNNIAAKGDREMTRVEMYEEVERLDNTINSVIDTYEDTGLSGEDFYKSQLKALYKRRNEYFVEIHKKEAIPFACAVLVLVGAPLGIVVRRGGKGAGFSIAILMFLLYYLFLLWGESFGDRGLVPTWLAMWLPNIILSGVGIFLIIRAIQEGNPLSFLSFLNPKNIPWVEKRLFLMKRRNRMTSDELLRLEAHTMAKREKKEKRKSKTKPDPMKRPYHK